jgi:hypothetical protein
MEDAEARAFAHQLTAGFDDELESVEGHARWHPVMLAALRDVRHLLPDGLATHLDAAPETPPTLAETESQRKALWNSIKGSRGEVTPRVAATRAILFLFYPYDDTGQDGAAWLFTWFYCRAGLPIDALEAAVRRRWPAAAGNDPTPRS